MSRTWYEVSSPTYLHETFGVYHGVWMPQMDRCWMSDDDIQVISRLLMTKWRKVEHAAITRVGKHTFNGEADLSWSTKMEIKNELFGEKRAAIEVFPKERNLVDVMDVYHLWVFAKEFEMPFGIHPTRDAQCRWIRRGVPKDVTKMLENSKVLYGDDFEKMGTFGIEG